MKTCKNCPHCGGELSTVKRSAKITTKQPIKIIDGKTYYGKMVNYSTGKAMSYMSFPDDGKPRKPRKRSAISKSPRINSEHLKGEVMIMPNSQG
jgi:hypothetical protein